MHRLILVILKKKVKVVLHTVSNFFRFGIVFAIIALTLKKL
jgi:hypothetical protein